MSRGALTIVTAYRHYIAFSRPCAKTSAGGISILPPMISMPDLLARAAFMASSSSPSVATRAVKPVGASERLGQFRVFPGARDRCRSNWVLFPRPLDEITVVVEHEHDSGRAEAPHGVDVVCGQLMGTFAGDQKRCAGPDRQVRCRKRPGWPSGSILQDGSRFSLSFQGGARLLSSGEKHSPLGRRVCGLGRRGRCRRSRASSQTRLRVHEWMQYPWPVKRVIVGPGARQEERAERARSLLGDIPVTISRCP
jgi:hypothetical protein